MTNLGAIILLILNVFVYIPFTVLCIIKIAKAEHKQEQAMQD